MAKKASDSELVVLSTLLETGEATATEIHAKLSKHYEWAHSTVVTFLRRLEAKGLVTHMRTGDSRAFVFRASPKAFASRRRALTDLLNRLFQGNPLPLVSSLLEEVQLEKEQIKALRALIDEHLATKEKKT